MLAYLLLGFIAQQNLVPLKTTFHVDGQLLMQGYPMAAWTGTKSIHFIERNGLDHDMSSLAYLKGFVTIKSPRDALNFVRLRGSPALIGVMRSEYGIECEIVNRKKIDESYVFGQTEVLKDLRRYDPGMFGFGNRRLMRLSGVTGAQVQRLKGGRFRVVRTMLTIEDLDRWSLIKISEIVGRDGSYRFTELSRRPTKGLWGFAFPA